MTDDKAKMGDLVRRRISLTEDYEVRDRGERVGVIETLATRSSVSTTTPTMFAMEAAEMESVAGDWL